MATQWTISNLISNTNRYQTYCTFSAIGGPYIVNAPAYFERTYTGLDSHTTVAIVFYTHIWDTWSSSDTLSVSFDGVVVQTFYPALYKASPYMNTPCAGHTEMDFRIVGNVSHSASTLTLRFTVSVDGSTGSFGINDVNMRLYNGSATTTLCATYATSSSAATSGTTCPCSYSTYRDISAQCTSTCNSFCYHCYGSTASDCYQCRSFGISNTYQGGACVANSVCSTGCAACDTTKCYICKVSYYYLWDYTCSTSCPTGYVGTSAGAYLQCDTPCQTAGTYMLSDFSCTSTCEYPFTPRIVGRAKFCDFPCDPSYATQFFNPEDNTCSTSCSTVTRTIGSYQICDLCSPNKFSYANGSCFDSCPSYMKQTPQSVYTLCQAPCPAGRFYYVNGTCSEECSYPWVQDEYDGIKFCLSPCSNTTHYFYTGTKTCSSSCEHPYQGGINNSVITCSTSCEAIDTYLSPNYECVESCSSSMEPLKVGSAKFCVYPKESWWRQYRGAVIVIIVFATLMTVATIIIIWNRYKKTKKMDLSAHENVRLRNHSENSYQNETGRGFRSNYDS